MKRMAITFAMLAVIGWAGSTAQAGHGHGYGYGYGGGYGGYGYGRPRGSIYHPPSVHYDRQYHADYYHWTPGRGLHSHGHVDIVPHYTPGHRDFRHGNHIHGNPWYHH